MKTIILPIVALALLSTTATAQQPVGSANLSYKNEIQRGIDKGLHWLEQNQHADGYWLNPDHPAVTALSLIAYQSNPNKPKETPKWVARSYAYILKHQQKDGSICVPGKGLANYNTSLCLMALLAEPNPAYTEPMKKARAYLVKQQWDLGEKGKTDHPLDGGVGYGDRFPHSDLNNTLNALEALYYSRHLIIDSPQAKEELNWAAAIEFIQNCQNLPSHNKQPWASDDPEQKGGFIYFPGYSMAGEVKNSGTGRIALRSYGSISYGGLLSYSYAQLKKDDPRVQSVVEWLSKNYTIEENPNLGKQGLYYYYFLMTKALSIYGADQLTVQGKKVNWKRDLSMKLLSLQQADGAWQNDNPRWWEKEKPLATAYSIIALSFIHRGL